MTQTAAASAGFTIVELLIVIFISGIITTIVVLAPSGFLKTARDQERVDDVTSIGRRLEDAYTAQDLGRPAYPSTTELAADIPNRVRTVSRLSEDAFKAPTLSTNSVFSATSTSLTAPLSGGPTANQYVYQPFTASNALCTASNSASDPCVRFNLFYRIEATNIITIIKSVNQQ